MINLLIADDQKLLRESFRNIIENNSNINVVGCVPNGKEAYDFCKNFLPDVVLMDISMPIISGTEATKLIKSKFPGVKVLILTASSDETDVSKAIQNGADGYIVKDIGTQELILSIKSASAGLGIIHRDLLNSVPFIQDNSKYKNQKNKIFKIDEIDISLTEKELKIIKMIVEGNSNKEIAASLFMAEGTVKNKITEIISKLQLKDKVQLAVFAIKNNLV